MKQFFTDKFEEILKFIDKNHEIMQSNDSFKKMVIRKASKWVMLSELLCNNNTTVSGINSVADLKGEITLRLKSINKKFTILPLGSTPTGKNDMKITPQGMLVISKLCEQFDAKVVDLK